MTQFVSTTSLRRFMAQEVLVAAAVNAVINIAAANLVFAGRDQIPTFGMDGVAFDLIPTSFFTAFLMVVMLSPILGKRMARGGIPRPDHDTLPSLIRWLPHSVLSRSIVLGVGAILIAVPPTAAILVYWGGVSLSFSATVTFKAIFGAVLGMLLCPLVVFPVIAQRD